MGRARVGLDVQRSSCDESWVSSKTSEELHENPKEVLCKFAEFFTKLLKHYLNYADAGRYYFYVIFI